MKHSVWIGLAAALTLLSACDRAKAPDAPPAAPAAAVERAGPVHWNEAAKAFELNGKPLKAAKLWTFEGTTEGFTVMTSKVASPQPAQGLALTIVDPTLRTPKGLNIVGGDYPVVLMRITRVAPGGSLWDGALYYSTPIHGEAIGFLGKPLQGGGWPLDPEGIRIDDEKGLRAKLWQRLLDAAALVEQEVALIRDHDARRGAALQMIDDLVSQVMHVHDGGLDAFGCKPVENVIEQRLAGNGDERLGQCLRDRQHARAASRGEDHGGAGQGSGHLQRS